MQKVDAYQKVDTNRMNREKDYGKTPPSEFRALVRSGEFDIVTCGCCNGFVQANLVILPQKYAEDFSRFAARNPKAVPVLEVTKPGEHYTKLLADHADILTDIPRYNVFVRGEQVDECKDVTKYWKDDFVAFLIGCSYSFEGALMRGGIEVRNITDCHMNSVYKTSIPCAPSHYFSGPLVVSMRPIREDQVDLAYEITGNLPHVHGSPIYHGDPSKIGVSLEKTDWGVPTRIEPGEVPVFWGCGVTPQAAIQEAKPDIVITHKPAHMFVSDILETEIESRLFG